MTLWSIYPCLKSICITNTLRTSACFVGHQRLLGHHLHLREKQVQVLQVVQAIHFCSRGLLDLQLWFFLLGAVHLRQLKPRTYISKLSTHLAVWLHLTSSFWHCHPWQSHHRTRHKSKDSSPVQLFTSESLDQLLKLLRSLSNSQISPYLSQPTLHNHFFQSVGDLWTTRNLLALVQTCKKNVQTESKE